MFHLEREVKTKRWQSVSSGEGGQDKKMTGLDLREGGQDMKMSGCDMTEGDQDKRLQSVRRAEFSILVN